MRFGTRAGVLLAVALMLAPLSGSAPAYADGFGQLPERWADLFCPEGEVCRVGDVNGDGRADLLSFVRSSQAGDRQGDVLIALSDGSEFDLTNAPWQSFFCLGDEICDVGDFNGDGRDDVVAFVREPPPGSPPGRQGDVYVALSNGSLFGPSGAQWQELFCLGDEVCGVGDFNGDGRDDVVAFVRGASAGGQRGDVYVALSTGSGFGPSGSQWQENFCVDQRVCDVGDFDGDGRDDVISFVRSSAGGDLEGDVYVALSTGSSFAVGTRWNGYFCVRDETCSTGDVNGDGRDDIVTFVRSTQTNAEQGNVYVALSSGSSFAPAELWQGDFCLASAVCTTGDASGDGRADAIAFVQSSLAGANRDDVYVARSVTADYLPPRLYFPSVAR